MKNFSQLVALGVVSMGPPGPNYGGPDHLIEIAVLDHKASNLSTLLILNFDPWTSTTALEGLKML